VKKPLTAAAAAKEKAKKHVAAEKAARTRAKDKAEHKPVHHVKVKVSHKPVVKRRKWSPDGDVACCSARAVAEALRLATGRVLSDADVVSLYWAGASDPDEGQTLSDALTAARELFGIRPWSEPAVEPDFVIWDCRQAAAEAVKFGSGNLTVEWLQEAHRLAEASRLITDDPPQSPEEEAHALILGLGLPWGEPHAVTYDPRDGTWWSWGQPYSPADFPGAVIEEAWAVSWARGGDALCAG
jgi:hypothetical protein